MKNHVHRLATFIAVMGLGAAAIGAGGAVTQTNTVQAIGLAVALYSQGPDFVNPANENLVTHRVTKTVLVTKDIIKILGAKLNTEFPANARLVRVEHPAGDSDNATIEIRQGPNILADVSSYFNFTVKRTVRVSHQNLANGVTSGKDLKYIQLSFNQGGTPSFDVQGDAVVTYVTVRNGRSYFTADEVDATGLSGTGAIVDATCIAVVNAAVHGTVTQVVPAPVIP